MQYPFYVSVYQPLLTLNASTSLNITWYVYSDTESILAADHKSLLSAYISAFVTPAIVAGQQLGKHAPATTNTRTNGRTVGRSVFYAVLLHQRKLGGHIFPELLWDLFITKAPKLFLWPIQRMPLDFERLESKCYYSGLKEISHSIFF
jgi:hypothetical protein